MSEAARYDFACPTESERTLQFRNHRNEYAAQYLSKLTPDDCRVFCWKDCAIYGNIGLTGQDHFTILDQVYEEWFPHRARDKNFTDGSFFGKLMQFTPAVQKVEDILRFHRTLCERLRSVENEVPDREAFPPYALRPETIRRERAFQLRMTFLSVLVVLNAGWEEHGVLVICDSEKCVRDLNVNGSEGDVARYEVDDGSDLGEAWVFRCPLKRAMKLVVSQDAERARKRKEYSELFDEIYGSEDETYFESRRFFFFIQNHFTRICLSNDWAVSVLSGL